MTRLSVKLVLLDDRDRLLLIQGQDPATGLLHWYPVGGGVEPGESLRDAAVREAWEETGLRGAEPAEHVWVRDVVYEYDGRRVEVHEDWLVCRVATFDPAPGRLSDVETRSIRSFRWWDAAELAATTDSVYPPDLGARLLTLLRSGPPPAPEDIGQSPPAP